MSSSPERSALAFSSASLIRSVVQSWQARKRARLSGNSAYTYGCETPALAAMSAVRVPW